MDEDQRPSTCEWCGLARKYLVAAVSPMGDVRRKHPSCSRHLAKAVEYVTVPGGVANVEVLR